LRLNQKEIHSLLKVWTNLNNHNKKYKKKQQGRRVVPVSDVLKVRTKPHKGFNTPPEERKDRKQNYQQNYQQKNQNYQQNYQQKNQQNYQQRNKTEDNTNETGGDEGKKTEKTQKTQQTQPSKRRDSPQQPTRKQNKYPQGGRRFLNMENEEQFPPLSGNVVEDSTPTPPWGPQHN